MIIKSADARNVSPFPARAAAIDPSWKTWLAAENARVRRWQRVRYAAKWAVAFVTGALAAVGLTWLCWWMAGR